MYYGERFNAWTHLVGALLALTGATWLIVTTSLRADAQAITSVSIYGAALVLLYAISTIYHSVRGRAKRIWQKCDHLSIYLMIAGSYTPFCLISLRGAWGWSLFGVVWGLAVLGMLQEIKPRSEARVLSLVIYAVMGWAVLVATGPLLEALGTAGFVWLAAGGLLYSVGIVFFVLDARVRHFHGIWHLFVIAGSLMHYIAILGYVLPDSSA
ncbi:PAQR family membrane homeostasis protein TrhA [Comamonas sp.]|uniref:PAQR family membrane homeostasis protein TrhA n=1 Tax=Comamonas sp. TaxID=34028 RepID=UPI0028A264E9|nr:hemolysin III family protein [Comamonas sp.]